MANVSKIKLNDETYNVKDAEARKPVDEELAKIRNEGSTQVSEIGLKGQEVLESIPEEYAALDAFVRGGLHEDDEFNAVDGYTIDFNGGNVKPGDRIAVIDFVPITDADYIEVVCTDQAHTSKYDQGYKIYEYGDDTESSYLGAHRSGGDWYWTDDNAIITPEKLQYNGAYIRLVFYSKLSVTVKAHYEGRRISGLSSAVDALKPIQEEVEDARIGNDNIEYSSLGNAVRTQFSDVSTQISNVNQSLQSSLIAQNFSAVGPGSIDGTTGQDGPTTTVTRARTNGYIAVDDLWYCNTRDTAYGMIAFLYDSSKAYIKRLRSNFVSEIVDRELLKNYPNAAYVRFAFSKGNAQMGDEDYKAISGMVRVYHSGDSPVINGEITAQEAENTRFAKIESNSFSTNYTEIEIGTISAAGGQNSASTVRCRTKGYISLDDFVCCNMAGTAYKIMYFMYDAQQTFIRVMPFEYDYINLTRYSILVNNANAAYVRIAFTRADGAAMTDADVVYLRTRVFIGAGTKKVDEDKARFDRQFNYVAYSQITPTDAPINSEEHFIYCANAGTFTSLKGDVRNTADGGLIMCHDAGYTFDGNGKITAYNKNNNTPIDTLTVAQCKALTFAEQWQGKDCHPCDFETFVRVCKKYGLIAYCTVRDEHIADVVAPETLRILTLYRMLDHCIINSFTKATLEIFRALNPSITLSLVLGCKYIPTNADIDYVVSLGNCNLNLFDIPLDSSVPGTNVEDKLENWLSGPEYTAVLEYAHSKNVVLYDAQVGNAAPDVLLRHGIVGAHMTTIPVWDWKRT